MELLSKESFLYGRQCGCHKKASGQLGRTEPLCTKFPHIGPGFCLKVEMLTLVSALGTLTLRLTQY